MTQVKMDVPLTIEILPNAAANPYEELARSLMLHPASADSLSSGDPAPPSPTSYPDVLPQTTDPWVVSQASPQIQLRLWWDWVHGNVQTWIPAPGQPDSDKVQYNNPIPSYNLVLRRYWRQLDSTALPPNQSYQRTQTYTTGTSVTDSSSVSAELGIAVDGLSASLSASFSHSVTISTEVSVSKQWTVQAPHDKAQQFVLWQLIEEVVALTPSGQIVTWPSGSITANIMPGMIGDMNGYISLPTTRVTSPQDFTMITQGP